MDNLPHNFHLTQEGRDHLDSISKLTFDGRIDKHPLHMAIYDLCQEIEKLPASEQATIVVSAAAALHEPVAQLLEKYDFKKSLTEEITLQRELFEAEKLKAAIFYRALKLAGAPLDKCQPDALYEWADNVVPM